MGSAPVTLITKTVFTLDGVPGGALVGTQASDAAGGGDNSAGSVLDGGGPGAGTDAATSAFSIDPMLSLSLGSRRIGGLTLKLQTSIATTR